MFNCTPVFFENYNSTAKVIVNQGGTASSKTFSIIQLLYLKAISEANQVITVVGESIPNLKKGAYRDAETIYNTTAELKPYISFWNKTDRIIYFTNGSIMEFSSYENHQSAKNGKRDYLFVNEANGVEWLIYWQLAIRTRKQIFIDYNPSAPFWAHDSLIGTDNVQLIISDHRHNTFLSAEEHYKIENIKDKELWLVYARGKTGNITGLIYPNWIKIPDEDFPNGEPFFGGIDFGYTNDPTALVKIVRIGDNIYLKELCYEAGLAPTRIQQILKAEGFTNSHNLYCEHDDNMIPQLRRIGVRALPARKGNGSVLAGIQKMKEFNVYYTAGSTNIDEERKRYQWKIDVNTGKPLNAPEDGWDHLLDAARYGVYTHFFKQ